MKKKKRRKKKKKKNKYRFKQNLPRPTCETIEFSCSLCDLPVLSSQEAERLGTILVPPQPETTFSTVNSVSIDTKDSTDTNHKSPNTSVGSEWPSHSLQCVDSLMITLVYISVWIHYCVSVYSVLLQCILCNKIMAACWHCKAKTLYVLLL